MDIWLACMYTYITEKLSHADCSPLLGTSFKYLIFVQFNFKLMLAGKLEEDIPDVSA